MLFTCPAGRGRPCTSACLGSGLCRQESVVSDSTDPVLHQNVNMWYIYERRGSFIVSIAILRKLICYLLLPVFLSKFLNSLDAWYWCYLWWVLNPNYPFSFFLEDFILVNNILIFRIKMYLILRWISYGSPVTSLRRFGDGWKQDIMWF